MADPNPPTVLLVDDESNVLSALRRVLRREPITIETAGSARAALAILEAGDVRLVISDHQMAGMSGIDLLKTIRAKWPSTKRMLLSGWSSGIAQADLDAAGLDAVISKPWNDDELRHLIREAVGKTVG